VRLGTPEIRQIAGRAGRYRTASQPKADPEANTGLVTSFESVDLPYIKNAMFEEPAPLTTAGIIPPDGVFHKFAAYFPPDVPFNYVLKRLMEIATVNPLFFLCEGSNQLQGTMLLDPVQGLSTEDRLTLMAAPINTSNIQSCNIAESFAKCVAGNTGGRFLDIDSLPLKVLEEVVSGKKEYLQQLETLHRAVILYLWLSYRFGGIFTDRALATHVKELAEERMVRALTEFSANKQLRRDASLRRQIALQKQVEHHEKLLAEADMTSRTSESQDEGESGSQSEGGQGPSVGSAAGEASDEGKPRLEAQGTA
jgi:ATP-dependent RNA helicase SUPV3L1/SUV3